MACATHLSEAHATKTKLERTNKKKKTCLILFCLINREGHVILPCNAVAERKLLIVIEGQVVGGYSAAIFIKSLLTNWLRK